ncbi:MAG: hypothetical protein KAI72_04685, partial [Candidatus Pacebacteria bacterium]|nr:hypothetical protein [Candidatus Paceibacterota bacterium]
TATIYPVYSLVNETSIDIELYIVKDCIFRFKVATHSGESLPPIPEKTWPSIPEKTGRFLIISGIRKQAKT